MIGIALRILISDAGADHRIDLHCDVEVDLQTDVNDAGRVDRKVEAAEVHVHEVDVLRIVRQHARILRRQVAAETRRDVILFRIRTGLRVVVVSGRRVKALSLTLFLLLVRLLLQEVAALDQHLRGFLPGFKRILVAVVNESSDHFGEILVLIRVFRRLRLRGHGHAEAGVGARLERSGNVQTGGQAGLVLVPLDLDGRRQQEFLFENDGGLDLERSGVADGNVDREPDRRLSAESLLPFKVLQVDAGKEGNVDVADFDFSAVGEFPKICKRHVFAVGLDGHRAKFVAVLIGIEVQRTVGEQRLEELLRFSDETAVRDLLFHLLTEFFIVRFGDFELHLRQLGVQQKFRLQDLFFRLEIVGDVCNVARFRDGRDDAVSLYCIVFSAERAGVECQIISDVQCRRFAEAEFQIFRIAEIIGGKIDRDLAVVHAAVVLHRDRIGNEQHVGKLCVFISVNAVAHHAGDPDVGDVAVRQSFFIDFALIDGQDVVRAEHFRAGIGQGAGAEVLIRLDLSIFVHIQRKEAEIFDAAHFGRRHVDHAWIDADVFDRLLMDGDVVFDDFLARGLIVIDVTEFRGIGGNDGIDQAALPFSAFGDQLPFVAADLFLLVEDLLERKHLLHGKSDVFPEIALQTVVLGESEVLTDFIRRRGR